MWNKTPNYIICIFHTVLFGHFLTTIVSTPQSLKIILKMAYIFFSPLPALQWCEQLYDVLVYTLMLFWPCLVRWSNQWVWWLHKDLNIPFLINSSGSFGLKIFNQKLRESNYRSYIYLDTPSTCLIALDCTSLQSSPRASLCRHHADFPLVRPVIWCTSLICVRVITAQLCRCESNSVFLNPSNSIMSKLQFPEFTFHHAKINVQTVCIFQVPRCSLKKYVTL